MVEEGAVPEQSNISSAAYEGAERRRKLRIYKPYAVTVSGVNTDRVRFRVNTNLDNISGGGLYLWLPQRLEPGAKLFIVVYCSGAPASPGPAARVAIRGRVLRVEQQSLGISGVAVVIAGHRFL